MPTVFEPGVESLPYTESLAADAGPTVEATTARRVTRTSHATDRIAEGVM